MSLSRNSLHDDPVQQFDGWLARAKELEPNDHNAMALSTVDGAGEISLRMVLLKNHGPQGLEFYTNLESKKGCALLENPRAAILFHWKSLRRQVRVEGTAKPTSPQQADAYFATRARGSQLGAWASAQSRPIANKAELIANVARATAKYNIGTIPRPEHWSGFRIIPHRWEFWQDGKFRLHDRFQYEIGEDNTWQITRLNP